MWFALGLFIVCFTIIVLFRMYIDLRRVDHQHIRMLQSDVRSHERYQQVRQLEAPKAALPDFKTALEIQQLKRRYIEPEALPSARYYSERDTAPSLEDLRAAERMVKRRPAQMTNAELQEAVNRYLQDDYDRFMRQQKGTL